MTELRPKATLPLYAVEQTKLLANAIDRASMVSFAVGVVMPLTAVLFDIGDFRSTVSDTALMTGIASWLVACMFLRWIRKLTLRLLG